MLKTLPLAALLASALAVATPTLAQDDPVTGDTILATVNGTEITMAHLIVLYSRLPEQYRSVPPSQIFDALLEQVIEQTAIGSALELSTSDNLTLENEARALLATRAIQTTADAAISDEAIQEAYEAAYANATAEVEYNASHILVEAEDTAMALITQLNDGADFAELARENSTGPSGPGGGELGWFGQGRMVPAFEAAVVALDVGAVSQEPVQTQFGWHVIKLNETRVLEAPPIDEVRVELENQVQRDAVESFIAETMAASEITQVEAGTIDPELLLDLSLVEN